MNDQDPHGGGERPVEALLRAALEARAQQITPHSLSIGRLPKESVRRTRPLYRVGVPLIAVAAAGAIGYASLRGSGALGDHQVTPAVSASGTVLISPTPSPAADASPSGSATASPSASGTASPSSTGSPSGTPSSTATTTVAPNTNVPGTWLAGSEYPLAASLNWGTPTLSNGSGNGPYQAIFSCQTGTTDPVSDLRTVGIDTKSVQGTAGKTTVTGGQWMLYFQDAAAATTAFDKIRNDYPGCAARFNAGGPTDLTSGKPLRWTVTETATTADGFAYASRVRDSAGKLGDSPNLTSDYQEFFVRSGNVITLVDIQGQSAQLDPSGGAAGVLAAMSDHLRKFF